MATPTDAQILTLSQWFSPLFPVGGFHFSHGLEWAIEAGDVGDAGALKDWIAAVLEHGSGRCDALFLAAAWRMAERMARRMAPRTDARSDAGSHDIEDIHALDAVARVFQPSAERLLETGDLGRAFGKIAGALTGETLPDLAYPVAVGWAAGRAGLPQHLTASMYLQAFVANLAAVGMRLVPVGQTDGQRIIRDLTPLCARIADETATGDLDDLGATAFLADIASMKHESQYSRIFRT